MILPIKRLLFEQADNSVYLFAGFKNSMFNQVSIHIVISLL
ncbi:hypothetical protein F652_526 [Enterobacteriaceae bacterium bta3-1]|nr:hypothetical protein F652_526 [Enterobacteriaceae bacterium bta3-1]